MANGLILQGEVYWIDLGMPFGSEPGYSRPYVVVQNDYTNKSAIHTTLACPITTNLGVARSPGNVRVNVGEGGLTEDSVINVSQVIVLDKERFVDCRGRLSPQRIRQVVDGIELLIEPRLSPI